MNRLSCIYLLTKNDGCILSTHTLNALNTLLQGSDGTVKLWNVFSGVALQELSIKNTKELLDIVTTPVSFEINGKDKRS